MCVCVRERYFDIIAYHRLASDGVWQTVGCAEYEDKYVNHVDDTISLLARTRIEEMRLTQQLADMGRLLRAGEWVNHESEVLGLPERCKQLTEENSQLRRQFTEESDQLRQQCGAETHQLRQQCAEETNQLREQVAKQAKELQSMKDLLAAKEKRGWFGK
jgi:DNA anti-recombination protein RmuC